MSRILKNNWVRCLLQKNLMSSFSAFDQVGNIIIVKIPDSLLPKKKLIGETLLEQVKSAKSVFYQSSSVEGEFRTRDLEIIAGDDKTETEYKESGCRFIVTLLIEKQKRANFVLKNNLKLLTSLSELRTKHLPVFLISPFKSDPS